MKDILLTLDGDLAVDENGDISLTDSVRQAVKIRLLWFFGEWRFAPRFGVPYFEDILVKSPNIGRIRRIVKREVESVDEVREARNISITVNSSTRRAVISFEVVTGEGAYREEVVINV
jgi:hypothetical protein